MLKLADDSIHIGSKLAQSLAVLALCHTASASQVEPGPGLGLLGGNDARFALVAAEYADLVEQLRVVDLAAGDGFACSERTSSTDFSLVRSL